MAHQLCNAYWCSDPAVIHVLRRICGVRDVKPREAANPKVAIPAKAKTPLEAPHPQMSVDELEDYCSCPITAVSLAGSSQLPISRNLTAGFNHFVKVI